MYTKHLFDVAVYLTVMSLLTAVVFMFLGETSQAQVAGLAGLCLGAFAIYCRRHD
jgi:hypothetical protein